MTDRAYTVREIDALRQACEHKYIWGTYGYVEGRYPRGYRESEMRVAVEEMVRTHMLAGHTADDLYASEREA